MSQQERRLAQGDWILVTGSNGYIASHVVDLLLEEGYNVRGTVRAEKPWLNRYFDNKYGKGRFETAILTSLEDETAFVEVVKGVSAVAHVAADVPWSPDPNAVIPKVITGTVNVLKAAAKEPLVKSVVITSSATACLIPEPNTEGVVDESTWNDAAVETAWSQGASQDKLPFIVYGASKTESERESWKWMEANKPHFVLNTVLPDMNLGPILIPEVAGSTMTMVRGLLNGEDSAVKTFPPQWYINVRDTARMHAVALLDPNVESQRLFAFAGPYNWSDIIGVLHKLRPGNTKIPQAPENEGRDLFDMKPSKRGEEHIKNFFGVPGWKNLETSIAEGIAGLE